MAGAMGVAQGALHCHEIPWRCSFPSNRAVRIRVRGPCHSGLVQLEACACAAACGNDSRGTCLSVRGCVRHRVRRAGGRRGSCARGACCGGARRARALCCRAAVPWIRSPPRPQRLWASSLLVPATQHGAGCGVQVCGGVGSRGRWSRVRWSRERCGRRLRCSSVGNVRWWGVAMAVGSAPEAIDTVVSRIPNFSLVCINDPHVGGYQLFSTPP